MIDWDMRFKGVPSYPYLRSLLPGNKLTAFRPKVRASWEDLHGLLSLFLLGFRSKRTVVFVPDRKEMLRLASEKFPENSVIFIRREVQGGNVFFIETIRAAFRLYSKVFIGDFFQLKDPRLISRSHDFIGDVLFNQYILYPLLRRHSVFFTNCVVPLCEKYQRLYDSCEIQHGIIYNGHHDYTDIPVHINVGPILAWNDFFVSVLKDGCKFPGAVESANFEFYEDMSSEPTKYGLILTTVDDYISDVIIQQLNQENLILRRHPRDDYDYHAFTGKIDDGAPLRRYTRIFCSDTTLIFSLKFHGLFFHYLPSREEVGRNVIIRLKEKYNVDFGEDYDFF